MKPAVLKGFWNYVFPFPHILKHFLRKPFQGSKMLKFQRFAVILKVFTQSYSFILLFIPECICFTLHVCIYDRWPFKGYKRIHCKHVYNVSLLFSPLISVLSDFLPKEDSLYVFKTNIAETSVLNLLKAGGYIKSNNLTRIIIRLYMICSFFLCFLISWFLQEPSLCFSY